jgi:O-antigen biosynthesis protein
MKLSIVIVNYNVKHFLEQALLSVHRAIEGLEAEVFVVDNNSMDGSVSMVRQRFPWVNLIASKENLGFSRGNNLAIRQATGDYVLLLNPDTVVEEDTFHQIVAFMDQQPDAGALGVKMINGKGEFLPESKRALPTPWTAFYKVFGLAKLFPRNRRFGHYHLTYLDPEQIHAVEVLSGAFMLLRKSVLDKIGLLDEQFFMYGEDIDLSYRVTQAGYTNYYYPHTQIIHYKGESTRKGSLNYVLVFYNAMRLFVRKHFAGRHAGAFLWIIQLAILARAGLSMSKRIVSQMGLPLLEGAAIGTLFIGVKTLWEQLVYHPVEKPYYDEAFNWIAAPTYALVFVAFLTLFGAYRRPYRIRTVFSAAFAGFIAIATISFLFKNINYSRAIVMLGSSLTLVLTLFHRGLLNYFRSGNFFLDERARKRIVIAGNVEEAQRVVELIEGHIVYNCEIIGIVADDDKQANELRVLGKVNDLQEVISFYQVDEVVFCNKSMNTQQIIEQMTTLSPLQVDFKIVPIEADYLIGPNIIVNPGGLVQSFARLYLRENRLKKQVLDLAISLGLVAFFPLTFWMYRRPIAALRCLWQVLMGEYHLVGYIDGSAEDLPKLKQSLLNMQTLVQSKRKDSSYSAQDLINLDRIYARNYSTALDMEIIALGLPNLGLNDQQ